jgi:hypothetical protein
MKAVGASDDAVHAQRTGVRSELPAWCRSSRARPRVTGLTAGAPGKSRTCDLSLRRRCINRADPRWRTLPALIHINLAYIASLDIGAREVVSRRSVAPAPDDTAAHRIHSARRAGRRAPHDPARDAAPRPQDPTRRVVGTWSGRAGETHHGGSVRHVEVFRMRREEIHPREPRPLYRERRAPITAHDRYTLIVEESQLPPMTARWSPSRQSRRPGSRRRCAGKAFPLSGTWLRPATH